MKWTKSWLQKEAREWVEFEEEIQFPKETFERITYLNKIGLVKVLGKGRYDAGNEWFETQFTIDGIMEVPCALSLEPVEWPFHIESTEIFTFQKGNEEDGLIQIKGDVIDLMPLIFQHIISEVPMRVVKEGAKLPNSGKNWKVIESEEIENKEPETDPRFDKLKDLFKDKK